MKKIIVNPKEIISWESKLTSTYLMYKALEEKFTHELKEYERFFLSDYYDVSSHNMPEF